MLRRCLARCFCIPIANGLNDLLVLRCDRLNTFGIRQRSRPQQDKRVVQCAGRIQQVRSPLDHEHGASELLSL